MSHGETNERFGTKAPRVAAPKCKELRQMKDGELCLKLGNGNSVTVLIRKGAQTFCCKKITLHKGRDWSGEFEIVDVSLGAIVFPLPISFKGNTPDLHDTSAPIDEKRVGGTTT